MKKTLLYLILVSVNLMLSIDSLHAQHSAITMADEARDSSNAGFSTLTDDEIVSLLKNYDDDLNFTENVGQTSLDIYYQTQFSGGVVRYLEDKINFVLPVEDGDQQAAFVWNMNFHNACNQIVPAGKELQKSWINYGKNRANLYKEVWYKGLYEGIDLRFYSRGKGRLEHDFIIQPGVSTAQIAFNHDSLEASIDSNGELVLHTPYGDLHQSKPYAYQMINDEEVEVCAQYCIEEGKISFYLGDYDATYALVIDPVSWEWATVIGGDLEESNPKIQRSDDGCFFVAGETLVTGANTIPTTTGVHTQTTTGSSNIFIRKYSPEGQLIYSTYAFREEVLGSELYDLEVSGNCAFIMSRATVIGDIRANATNADLVGTTPRIPIDQIARFINGFSGIYIQKFNQNGLLEWGTLAGEGGLLDQLPYVLPSSNKSLVVTDNSVWVSMLADTDQMPIYSNGLRITTNSGGGGLSAIDFAAYVAKLDKYSGRAAHSTFLEKDSRAPHSMCATDNVAYILTNRGRGQSTSSITPELNTVAPTTATLSENLHKVVEGDGPQWIIPLPGNQGDIDCDESGNVYLVQSTDEQNLTTTSGAFQSTKPSSGTDLYAACINPDGMLQWGSYLGGDGLDEAYEVFARGNGCLYLQGETESQDFPAVNGINGLDPSDGQAFFAKFNNTGDIVYSTTMIGEDNSILLAADVDEQGCTYAIVRHEGDIAITESPAGFPAEGPGNLVLKLAPDGQFDYILPIDGDGEFTEERQHASVVGANGSLYYAIQGDPTVESVTTDRSIAGGVEDIYVGCIGEQVCPDKFPFVSANEVSPNSVMACINGSVPAFTGSSMEVALDSLETALLYSSINQSLIPSASTVPSYQWQFYDEIDMAWKDIVGATLKDYLPSPQTADARFRRAVFLNDKCPAYYSNEVLVEVSNTIAPELPAATTVYKCVSSTTTIDATATGGVGPYTYSWSPSTALVGANGCATFPNCPVVETNTAISTIYVVTVEDADGCRQNQQYAVSVYEVDAGPDNVVACAGEGVRIGMPHIAPGISGFSYNWTSVSGDPVSTLSCTDCAEPIAIVSNPTVYELTITGPDGCSETDQITVTPSSVTAVAHAQDSVGVCVGDVLQLGETPQSGFTYRWSPVVNIDNAQIANPLFKRPSLPDTNDNPEMYVVTKTDEATGCQDIDTVYIVSFQPDPGTDGCGPRYAGTPNNHGFSGIEYEWRIASQTGGVTTANLYDKPSVEGGVSGTTDLPIIWVEYDTATQSVILELTVSTTLQGITYSCSEQIELADCLCLFPYAKSDSETGCSIATSGTEIYVNEASIDLSGYTYRWFSEDPSVDINTILADPTDPNPQNLLMGLDDDISLIVRATYIESPMFYCHDTLDLFGQFSSLPVAVAIEDTVCVGEVINVGGPATAGWSAEWTAIQGDANYLTPRGPGMAADVFNPYFLAITAGTYAYEVVVTDEAGNGCQARDTARILVEDIPADAGPDGTFCGNTIIQLGTPGIPGFTYQWEPANALACPTCPQPIDTIFAETTYYLTVTDASGNCTKTDQVTWTPTTPPSFSPLGGTVCEGSSINIGAAAIGGQSYRWSPAASLDDPTSSMPLATPTATTLYSVTVSNGSPGCETVEQVIVTVLPSEDIDAGEDALVCRGDSYQLMGSGSNVDTYLWSPADGLDDVNIPNPTITSVDRAITYTLTTTHSSGCSQEDQVTIAPSTPVANAGPNVTQCEGSSVGIGTAEQTGYTYSWEVLDGGGATTGLVDPTSAMTAASPDMNISYQLTAIDENGCIDRDTVTVTFQSVVADAGVDQLYCPSTDGAVTIGTAAIPDHTYSWTSVPAGFSSTEAMPSVMPLEETTYFLEVTNSLTACTATDMVVVTPNITADAGSNKLICTGGSATLEAMNVTAGATVSWSATPADPSLSGQENMTTITVSPTETTVYTLSVTNGTCSTTDEVEVSINVDPDVDAGSDAAICMGACAVIGAETPIFSFTYSWSANPADPNLDQNSPVQTVCPTVSTAYTLTKTNRITGCSSSDVVFVSVSSTPAPVADAGGDHDVCSGEVITIGTTEVAGMDYSWSPNAPILSPSVNVAQPMVVIPNDVAPTSFEYTLTVTDPNTGCFGTDTVVINVNPDPVEPAVPVTVSACLGGRVELCPSCTENTDYTYAWSPTTGLDDPSKLNAIAQNITQESTYTLRITNTANGGCTKDLAVNVVLSGDGAPEVEAGDDRIICEAGRVTLGAEAATDISYSWEPTTGLSNPNISMPIYTPTANDTVTFTVTATNNITGCSNVDVVTIITQPSATPNAGVNSYMCEETYTLQATPAAVGMGTWSVQSGPGGSFDDVNNPNAVFTPAGVGEHILRWTITGDVCNSGVYDDVTIVNLDQSLELISAVCVNGRPQYTAVVKAVGYATITTTPSYPVIDLGNGEYRIDATSGVDFEVNALGALACSGMLTVEAPTDCETSNFDLALTKVLPNTATKKPGDTISFDITVYNQGNIDAFNVEVADYFDTDALTFVDHVNTPTGFTPVGTNGGFKLDVVLIDTSSTVTLRFVINDKFTGTSILNAAEIIAADDDLDDTNTPPVDEDSPLTMTGVDMAVNEVDNDINDDPDNPLDQDDFDTASVTVCPSGCGQFPWRGDK